MRKKYIIKQILIIFLAGILFGCKTKQTDLEQALSSINTLDLTDIVKVLGSDEFQGRRPFTLGEEKTINYLKSEFERLGLKPGNGDSYFQDVPLVEVNSAPLGDLKLNSANQTYSFSFPNEFVAGSWQIKDKIKLENSELIFVGYGIVAPEYNWNDYKNVDVKGKTVVVLVNDPGFASKGSSFFRGRTMTYYGRWTYKYEEAARQGADGILIIHQTKPAGYPWDVVRNGALIPDLHLVPNDNYSSRCKLEGWLTHETAKTLFKNAGIDFSITMKAAERDFEAISLNTSISTSIESKQQYKTTKNVLALLEGSKRPKEVIIYSGHWDHLGIGLKIDGDSIYNGAVDNGTTIAWMFEIAEAFTKLETKPERSILFFAPSAEETGLLGSSFYAENPLFPMEKTVANINNDIMLPYGKMRDVMITGFGQSELEDYVAEAAKIQGRYLLPDPNPHTGMFFRSDHFSFVKKGVPSLFVRGNNDSWENGKEWMAKKELNWLKNNYHKPTDEYDENWDLSGVADDAKLLFRVGYKLSNESHFPKWKEGSEFKSILKR